MNYSSKDFAVRVEYNESSDSWSYGFAKTFDGFTTPGISGSQTGFHTKKEAIDSVMEWVENEGLPDHRVRKIREILEHESV